MEIIPVIDIMDGRVVRARMGQRDQYHPIETPLSATSDPLDVAQGLLSIFPFRTLYIADLDAIMGRGNGQAALVGLKNAFPRLEIWVDNGLADKSAARIWLDGGWGHLVLGSETQADAALVENLKDDPHVVLSLDFRGDSFVGPASLLADADVWPRRVIVMTLARVGSGAGPDIARLIDIRKTSPDRQIYAAGGVRDVDDLIALKRAGIAGALIATSLHDGRLKRSDIERL
jgi:phosphoribosylformimino-5-aminoimidazole carboxamide ribotide isomerase